MRELGSRREHRFQLTVPVTFWWTCADRAIHRGEGVTRDISKGGVLVRAAECPPVGAPIQIAVALQRLRDGRYGMTLSGEGTVIRVIRNASISEPACHDDFAAAVTLNLEPLDGSEQLEHISADCFE
jgi:PilZ domain